MVPGKVYVAPNARHLGVRRPFDILTSDDPPTNGFRPSADFLFKAVARAFGPGTIGIVLTGMGVDGVEGAKTVIESGGKVFAQDEASSVVYGMPRAVFEAGVVNAAVPLSSIASTLMDAV